MSMDTAVHTTCGRPAFYVAKRRRRDVVGSDVVLLDGTAPDPNTPMVCGSCGEYVDPVDLQMRAS